MSPILGLLMFAILIIAIISLWKIFEKAGVEGWKALIPFYNMWVLAEIVGKPGWLGLLAILLTFVPFIGALLASVLFFYLYYLLAKSFGKGVLFALGLFFLGFIFFPILGFGDDKYLGPPEDDIMKKIEEQK